MENARAKDYTEATPGRIEAEPRRFWQEPAALRHRGWQSRPATSGWALLVSHIVADVMDECARKPSDCHVAIAASVESMRAAVAEARAGPAEPVNAPHRYA